MRTLFTAILCLWASLAGAYTEIGTAGSKTNLMTTGDAQDVQAAIDAVTSGGVVQLPAGVYTWNRGVNTRGKHLTLRGQGCVYYLGWSRTAAPVSSSGSPTFTIPATLGGLGVYNEHPPSLGQWLRIGWKGDVDVWMEGTVASVNSGQIVMNMQRSGNIAGGGRYVGSVLKPVPTNPANWFFRTIDPGTTIKVLHSVMSNSNPNGPSYYGLTVTESTTGHVVIEHTNWEWGDQGGDTIDQSGNGAFIGCFGLSSVANGKAILIKDCSFLIPTSFHPIGGKWIIFSTNNRGVISRCCFDQGWAVVPIHRERPQALWPAEGTSDSWSASEPAFMGDQDQTGERQTYVERCYFGMHRYGGDFQAGARFVLRWNILDNTSFTSHGPEIDFNTGARSIEFYNNWCLYDTQGDYSGLNNWYYWSRGGTFTVTLNYVETIGSGGNPYQYLPAWQTMLRVAYTGSGNIPCQPTSNYPVHGAPGQGWVGGTWGSQPIYVWGNTVVGYTGVGSPSTQGGYGYRCWEDKCNVTSCNSSTPDHVAVGRDVFFDSPRPNYARFQFPHPLAGGSPITPSTDPPSITVQPVNITNMVGADVTFTVGTAGATPFSWQWKSNNVAIGGATASSYTSTMITAAQNGWDYRVVITNLYGSVTSSVVTLTVTNPPAVPPTILTNPVSVTVTEGQTAFFQVAASGASPIHYYWRENGILCGSCNILANNISYSSVTTNESGQQISVVVSNLYGMATSTVATLTVNAAVVGAYYVDESAGNDSNPGTQALPWRSCPGFDWYFGQGHLIAGDTVYFDRSDTWTFDTAYTSRGAWEVVPGVHYIGDVWDPEGAGTGRATLKPTKRQAGGIVRFIGDHPSIPTWIEGFEINGNGQTNNCVDINGAFCAGPMTGAAKRIERVKCYGNAGNGTAGYYQYAIIVGDNTTPSDTCHVSNVEIIDCTVTNGPRDHIAIYAGADGNINNVTVRGCDVSGPSVDASYSEGHGIDFKGPVRNSSAVFNYVHDVEAAGIFLDGPEFFGGTNNCGPSNVLVGFNIIRPLNTSDDGCIRFYTPANNPGAPIYATVLGNLILPNSTLGGLSFGGCKATNLNVKIYNNTFVNARVDIGNPTLTASTIEFINNVIYQTNAVPFTDLGSDVTTHAYNLYYTDGSVFASQGGSDKTAATILAWESTALTNNPAFTNIASLPTGFTGTYGVNIRPNTDGLKLSTNSPALDTGMALGSTLAGTIEAAVVRSVTGSPLNWDRGAYEAMHNEIPVPPQPPATNVVTGVKSGNILIFE